MGEDRVKANEGSLLTRDELQAELLELMVVFDRFCRDRQIRYFMVGGTLLGAVRHKGFIPWDDDMDVGMPRPDYEKLLEHKEELPDGYRILTGQDSGYPFPTARMINTNIRAFTPAFGDRFKEYLWMDIIPYDGVNPHSKEYARYIRWRWLMLHIGYSNARDSIGLPKRLASFVIRNTAGRILTPQQCVYKVEQRAKAIEWGSTDYVGSAAWGPNDERGWYPYEWFAELSELDFCDKRFYGPKDWHEVLSKFFGDYMTIPPVEKQITHGVQAWRIDEASSGTAD